MPNPNVWHQLGRLWPMMTLLCLGLQFIFPRLLRNSIDKNDKQYGWIHLKTRSGGKAAEYLSYLFISGSIVTICTALAFYKWSDIQSIPAQDRLYAPINEAQLLGSIMLGYQLYNFAICFILPKDCGQIANYAHHASTAFLAYFVLYPYVNYYAFFFVGIAEATNIPLTVVDACRAFPKLKEQIPKTNTMARLIFAISFFIVRVFWWPYVSYTFWLLSIDLIRNGDATKIHNIFVVYIFLIGNIGLTFLQFFWGQKILLNTWKMIKSDTKKNDTDGTLKKEE